MKILNAGLMVDPNGENGFQKAMKKVATGGYAEIYSGTPNFDGELLRLAQEFKPDLIFLQLQADCLSVATTRELAKIAFVMEWTGDVRDITPSFYIDRGRELHLMTYSNMVDVTRTLGYGVRSAWLDIGYDPERYKRWDNPRPNTPEIVAHFNQYGAGYFPLSSLRQELLLQMKNVFGTRFGVAGRGWEDAYGEFNGDQCEESRAYCGAKIAINLSHFNYQRYSSDRMLRALGSGVMVLSHYFQDIELDYKVGIHLDTFDTIDTLIHKCHYYLADNEVRQKIADAGYEHARATKTFDSMCENIVKLYNENKR